MKKIAPAIPIRMAFSLKLKLNYLSKLHGYPQFSY